MPAAAAPPPGSFTIGLREVYDQLVALASDVAGLRGEVAAANGAGAIESAAVDKTLSDHEDRIRSVERWKYALPIGAVLAALNLAAALLN